jgi:SIR2-like domain
VPPSPAILEDLRRVYEKGELIVFVGPGVSKAGGLPTMPELVQRLLDQARGVGAKPSQVEEIEGYVQQRKFIKALSALKMQGALGELEFNIAVTKALDDSALPLPEVARAIGRLGPKLRAAVTTNADRLLERALGNDWETFTNPPGDLAQAEHYILKLHGTRRLRSTWVFTQDQYDAKNFGRPTHRAVFQSIFRSHRILFVGYEPDDDDLEQTLQATRELAGESPPEHFALLPGPVGEFRRASLEQAGLRLLVYDADAELPGILDRIPRRARRREAHRRRAGRARRPPLPADCLRRSPPRARPPARSLPSSVPSPRPGARSVSVQPSSTSSATGGPSSAWPSSPGPFSASA